MKTKGEKEVIKRLSNYSESEYRDFSINKEVYYDAMDDAIRVLSNAYYEKSGQGIDQLIHDLESLRQKKELVEKALKDVEQTIEFNVD